jgi:pyruvate/2-oxoglutarate dehydrogenase complex dihydrolipoamide dehydrogenase (E3) component/uncharacterized membrane protein YdjX (TVP38/TMEM64 family)
MGRRGYGRILLLLALVLVVAAVFLSPLREWLTLASLKSRQADLAAFVDAHWILAAAGFFLVYVAATAISFPGAAILTIAAGAIFGLWPGLVIVSFASSIGASLAFLGARYLLRDWVERRFGRRLEAVDRGVGKDGIFYLLTLRLNPVVPFWMVNLGMGLTRIPLPRFYAVSQVGMLPATFVYVNAGTQLGRIERLKDIVSPGLLLSFLLLSLFPLAAKWLTGRLRRRRVYRGWTRPRRFDRNLVVVGAGAGGLVTAYVAAAVRAKVTLIEAREMGGDCLNTGCVPSKTLIACAKAAHQVERAADFLGPAEDRRLRFDAVMERVHAAIAAIAPNDGAERYEALGVDVRRGHATMVDPWTVEIDGGQRLTARSIVIAAGGEPFVPELPGLAESGYLTSETMWAALRGRESAPARLAIVGGGPIGCEMAQAFARLGSAVTLVESGPRLLPREDEEVSALLADVLREEGVEVLLGREAARVDGKTLVTSGGAFPFDELLIAIGRRARLSGYGLEALGIETSKTVITDAWLETRFPNIYAVGDVAGPYQLTHAASHQAWHAAVNALFGRFHRFRVDYSALPWVTFTDPEIAHVGHNEDSARAAGIPYELVRFDLAHLDRAVAEGARRGFVKLLVAPGRDRILGATIAAAGAGEMIAEIVLAIRHKLGLGKILATVHAYPTMAEANKYAAGEWRRAHQPERLLRLAELYHRWRRR